MNFKNFLFIFLCLGIKIQAQQGGANRCVDLPTLGRALTKEEVSFLATCEDNCFNTWKKLPSGVEFKFYCRPSEWKAELIKIAREDFNILLTEQTLPRFILDSLDDMSISGLRLWNYHAELGSGALGSTLTTMMSNMRALGYRGHPFIKTQIACANILREEVVNQPPTTPVIRHKQTAYTKGNTTYLGTDNGKGGYENETVDEAGAKETKVYYENNTYYYYSYNTNSYYYYDLGYTQQYSLCHFPNYHYVIGPQWCGFIFLPWICPVHTCHSCCGCHPFVEVGFGREPDGGPTSPPVTGGPKSPPVVVTDPFSPPVDEPWSPPSKTYSYAQGNAFQQNEPFVQVTPFDVHQQRVKDQEDFERGQLALQEKHTQMDANTRKAKGNPNAESSNWSTVSLDGTTPTDTRASMPRPVEEEQEGSEPRTSPNLPSRPRDPNEGRATPRTEIPKTQTPRNETPRQENPRQGTPRNETPRNETPRTETPRNSPRGQQPSNGGGGNTTPRPTSRTTGNSRT